MPAGTDTSGREFATDVLPWSRLNLSYLAERAGLDPARQAIVCDDRVRTYGELRERSRRVANGLLLCGVERMQRVAVTARNRLEYFEVELGISGAAAIMVALSWRLSDLERINLLARSESKVVFTDDIYVPALAKARANGELPDLEWIVSFGAVDGADIEYEEFCARASAERPDVDPPSLNDPHEIIYTSGTTGAPKGVVWGHGTVLWNSIQQVMDYHLRPEHSTYVMLDLNYIGGRHDFTWALLHQGGTVHVRTSGGFDADEAVRYIVDHRISHILLVPTMVYDALRVPDLSQQDTSAIEMIMCGGAPLSRNIVEQSQKAFPHTRFVQVFGLTEGGGTTTFVPPEYLTSKVGSAGKASMHNDLAIFDDDGARCAPGEIGQIVLRGPSVMLGYWNDPDTTARTIVDGWLHTGDLGYFDEDDFLYVVGRKKDMIISGGMNIYPSDIEGVLRGHQAVFDVAVIGLPDERWGEQVCAVIQSEEGASVGADDIIEYCRERLASFKKPKVVHVVEEMPRTISRKVQKHVLKEWFAPPQDDK